jgi:hypothetical protein
MRHTLFLIFLLLSFSCKNDAKNSTEDFTDLSAFTKTGPPKDPEQLSLPSACEMISSEKLSAILQIDASSVFVKDASDPQDNKTKSCFFKWEDPGTTNAGILIQIQTNPVYGDYPEYITNYVRSKITEGETLMGENQPTKFTKLTIGEINGAFSFKQGRFYWNLGNDYLFMLAFNLSTISEDKMKDLATSIINEVNKNFASKVKS